MRFKKRKNYLQTHFRTLFFAPEQQHTIYVQSSFIIFLFSNQSVCPLKQHLRRHPLERRKESSAASLVFNVVGQKIKKMNK